MSRHAKVMVVLGTRPEAVKLAPVIRALKDTDDLSAVVAVTGQHREIMDEVLELFDITPDHDLALLRDRQTLTHVTTRALTGVEEIVQAEQPDLVVVQGDTTTTFAASLAAFYQRVPVVHVEAGLRSGNRMSPYPEEINRQLTSRLATLHLCPTPSSKANLLSEAVDPATIFVTGNTVIDALNWVVEHTGGAQHEPGERRLVLMTSHRRESWDGGLANVAWGVRDVVEDRPDVHVVFPIHPNPIVREAMTPILGPLDNVEVIEPLGYPAFAQAMARAHVIVTDSGGVQEEAPSLGVPVLVTRENTERPEAVTAGTVRLIGSDRAAVREHLQRLLDNADEHETMRKATNPYGDGKAAWRSVGALRTLLWGDPRPEEFAPSTTDTE